MKYKIHCLTKQGLAQTITAEEGANLLAVLRERRIPLEAACGGKGVCGKCRVQIMQGNAPVTEEECRFLTAQELASGLRLACKASIQDNLTVYVQGGQMEIQALGLAEASENAGTAQKAVGYNGIVGPGGTAISAPAYASDEKGYDIAVDLGSTTLVAALTDSRGNVLAQASSANSQRAYGADVISRIQASNEGKRERLQACICQDLENLFRELLSKKQGNPVQVSKIAVAGNTVMMHLLRGYSCESLGQAPFEPVSLELECLDYGELFAEIPGCSGSIVYLLPGMSAFVGADITAGLYSSGFWQASKSQAAFFIDLGTNGELALGGRDGFVTTSTAAGPAFEGARLSCGIPGIPGAISKVSYLYHRVRVQTVGQKKPCGICGTGAMEAVAALLREGLMDADGLLAQELFETGMLLAVREDGSKICLTQADIREIQMAKAAIRAGIEVLQKKYQEACQISGQASVSRIYLAGGFGHCLSADTAVSIGLFPPEWKDKIISSGNASLKGAIAFLKDPSCAGELEEIRRKNQSVRLEGDLGFQDIYVREMRFPGA